MTRHISGTAAADTTRVVGHRARQAPISGMGGSVRARVGRGGRVPRVAAHRDAGPVGGVRRGRSRDRCSATSWRTSRCTNTSAICRRAGSTRATRATRRARLDRDDALATNVALAITGHADLRRSWTASSRRGDDARRTRTRWRIGAVDRAGVARSGAWIVAASFEAWKREASLERAIR